MEQQKYAEQETALRARFLPAQDSLKRHVSLLKSELAAKAIKRDELVRIAQEEADGTGGSKIRNLGPIYKVKKADADAAEKELSLLTTQHGARILDLEQRLAQNDSLLSAELTALERSKLNGLAARIEALNRLTERSSAVWWAHWFIVLLFIAVETAPVFVKLISSKGPYDNLLKIEEHGFSAMETEELGRINSQVKERASTMPQHERTFVGERLDAALKRS
jgi:hypothetical protein